MQAGISTATLFVRRNNEDALALFSEWGVPVAEVFLTSFCEYDPAFARLCAEKKGGVQVHSVHVLNTQFEPQLYAKHPRVTGDAFRLLSRTMECANILGANCYTFHGIARIKRTFREDLERSGEQTRAIAEVCGRYGVALCYENVEWALYNRPGVFSVLKEHCPALRGVLDLKQARITGYDYFDYLKEMGSALSHVHVSDITAEGKMCLPGKGITDFPLLIRRLCDVGFDGPLLIENYSGDFEREEELKASFEWLSDLMEHIG